LFDGRPANYHQGIHSAFVATGRFPPAAAVRAWRHAFDFDHKVREPAERVPRVEWDKGTWEEVLPEPYEEFIEALGAMASREDHARCVMRVSDANGSRIVKDIPNWAKDIIAERDPTFADRFRALEDQSSPQNVSEHSSPQPEVLVAPRPDYDP
jgi:hypothetical protein